MEALNTMSHQLEVDITAMLQYFGEDPLNTKPEEFLGLISNFSSALQVCDAAGISIKGLIPVFQSPLFVESRRRDP